MTMPLKKLAVRNQPSPEGAEAPRGSHSQAVPKKSTNGMMPMWVSR